MGEPTLGRRDHSVATIPSPEEGTAASNRESAALPCNPNEAIVTVPADREYRSDDSTSVRQADLATADSAAPPRRGVTVETALFGLLFLGAALTRLWDLGSRTLHHDESLHTYYSWLYATGQGYVHDPLMHGPFLFHANALVYLLLGASDATSRLMPALFGTILVGLPWLLRGPRHLGRWGALTASLLLLVSPSLLYQSRYIRHDIYTVVGAMVLFIAIMRYLDRPDRRWLVTAGASVGFLLTNHEIVFGIAAIFVAVLWGALLWDRLRFLVPLHLLAGLALGALWLVQPGPLSNALPEIPWSRAGSESAPPTRENQLDFYWQLLTHPLVITILAGLTVTLAVGVLLVVRSAAPDRTSRLVAPLGLIAIGGAVLWVAVVALLDEKGQTAIGEWQPIANASSWRFLVVGIASVLGLVAIGRGLASLHTSIDGADLLNRTLGRTPAGSVPAATLRALRDPSGLAAAFTVGGLIFAILYTSLFSNVEGLFTGTIATDGTLNYWLGQHDYRRGDQPWFYYLLLMPQYEVATVLFGVPAAIGVGVATLRALPKRQTSDPRFFLRLFLTIWFLGILAALSWAGEKMPWLIVHITLPAILLAASLLGGLIERWSVRRAGSHANAVSVPVHDDRRAVDEGWGLAETLVVGVMLVAAGSWFVLSGRLTYGGFVEGAEAGGWVRVVTARSAERWWLLLLPPTVVIAVLAVGWIITGARRTGRAALSGVLIGVVLIQIHGGWRMSFLEGDVPKDMLIYTQTSPDVTRMVREIDVLSEELTGGKGIAIWHDSGVSWPLQWYLRDFPNRALRNGPLAGPPDDVPVVIATNDNLASVEPFLSDYTAQEYVLRWWFPESIYRDFAIAPELDPSRSAWDGSDEQRSPLAIARSIRDSAASLLVPEGQQDLYRLLIYRDLPTPIGTDGGTFRYTVFVRNDLIPVFNSLRY